jgi:hypothetical protein
LASLWNFSNRSLSILIQQVSIDEQSGHQEMNTFKPSKQEREQMCFSNVVYNI